MQAPDYFVFIPEPGRLTAGTLYTLEKAAQYAPNSFVLLPYANPQTEKTKAQFYRIQHSVFLEDLSVLQHPLQKSGTVHLKSVCSKQQYLAHVQKLKQHIQLGDIYEINYCLQLYAEETTIDPVAVFLKLHVLAKAPYAMLVKLDEEWIISASPELFLKKEGERISSKPIKGTIRRGKSAEEDAALKKELHENIKERTENVMAVDVARNDLSRIAKRASVTVNQLYTIETFETVHQMVSTVSCEQKEGTTFQELIQATFPMASMTGAPKLRAMQLIDTHEQFQRNFYSGAMGLIDAQGDFSLSVIIRSIFYNSASKRLSLAVGSAITYLSEAEQEYEECLLKARALMNALDAEWSDDQIL